MNCSLTPRCRQNALNAYEAAQRKQLEDFEAHKLKKNSRIEEEIEKIRAHYAQRIQANLGQVASEKEALRNCQNAMQGESQRIGEVIERCGTQPSAVEGEFIGRCGGRTGRRREVNFGLEESQLSYKKRSARKVMSLLTAWLLSSGKRPAASSRVRHRVC